MSRPIALEPIPDNIPAVLRAMPRWIVWKHYFHKKRQKWIKLPVNPITEEPASTTDPNTWCHFDAALACYEFIGGYDGLGFVFAEGDGLVGIDIDDCLDGGLSDMARDILASVPGYSEVSPSGKGIHIITRGEIGRAYKSDDIGLEIYTKSRYFAITGVPVPLD